MGFQTLLLRAPSPVFLPPLVRRTPNPTFYSPPAPCRRKPDYLRLPVRRTANLAISVSTAHLPPFRSPVPARSPRKPFSRRLSAGTRFSDSTRTVIPLLAAVVAATGVYMTKTRQLFLNLQQRIDMTPTSEELTQIQDLQSSVLCAAVGPLFFASTRYRSPASLNTPLVVVAEAMAKALDLYSHILTIRCLLSWFPNTPWDRYPLSAIRDLCDPFLNLFRDIIPPVFGVDFSSLFAFAFLGMIGNILRVPKGF